MNGSGAIWRLGVLVSGVGVPLFGAAGCLAGEAQGNQPDQQLSALADVSGESDHCEGCQTYRFRLLQGEHPVCSVYAERLAATPVRHPFCNFDFPAEFKGIQEFPKRRLSPREIYEVQVDVYEFDRGLRGSIKEAPWPLRTIERHQGHALDAWVLDDGIDIDGDASFERILLWSAGACWGADDNRQNVRAYVFREQGLGIDWERTERLLLKPQDEWVSGDRRHNFLSYDLGFLEYEGETFVTGQQPTEQGTLLFELYRYRNDGAETVCTVDWEGDD